MRLGILESKQPGEGTGQVAQFQLLFILCLKLSAELSCGKIDIVWYCMSSSTRIVLWPLHTATMFANVVSQHGGTWPNKYKKSCRELHYLAWCFGGCLYDVLYVLYKWYKLTIALLLPSLTPSTHARSSSGSGPADPCFVGFTKFFWATLLAVCLRCI